ncbi:MAG: deoxyhypusine synthase [Thermoplasmata archaeon]|nr:MAG: deoxyhypusine synthase [Thermoplasmata archaeon]
MIVEDIDINVSSVDGLIKQFYKAGGFSAKKIGVAADIIEEMVKEDYFIFLTFPACIVATGTRGVIKELVKEKVIDAIITTCGSLDHDLARCFKDYYHGSFDANDEELHKKGINRLGNIFIPNESYGEIIEKKIHEIFEGKEGKYSSKEIAWEIGRNLKENAFLYWAWKNDIPVYIPAITDGAVGWQLWMLSQEKKFEIDVFKDEKELADIFFDKEKIGGIILGGGVSKHHLIWWAQFHGGLDAAVYITSAVEWDGSLSGARMKEAISWGKVKEKAKHVTVEGDATVLFPLLIASLFERIR